MDDSAHKTFTMTSLEAKAAGCVHLKWILTELQTPRFSVFMNQVARGKWNAALLVY